MRDRTSIIFCAYLCLIAFVTGCAANPKYYKVEDTVTIIAEGEGKDQDAALKMAFKKAVRNAFGTKIQTETGIQNRTLTDNSISLSDADSKTFIKNYQVIDSYELNGEFHKKISASVSTERT